MQPARIVLFGIRCRFTNIVAGALAESQHTVEALLLPGLPSIETPLRMHARRSLLPMASTNPGDSQPDVPTFQIGDLRSTGTREFIQSFKPDLIFVACFTSLIPASLYQLARHGAFNIHPSLLPAHRGPDPLFWIMRDGGVGCGVTIHHLSDDYDTGAIAAQQQLPYPNGSREAELESILAHLGADLALQVADDALNGTLTLLEQDEQQATYESWPAETDYAISSDRPVQDAWNFVRGVADRGVPARVDTLSGPKYVGDAIAFGTEEAAPTINEPTEVLIQFSDGWLHAHSSQDVPN